MLLLLPTSIEIKGAFDLRQQLRTTLKTKASTGSGSTQIGSTSSDLYFLFVIAIWFYSYHFIEKSIIELIYKNSIILQNDEI